MRCTECDIQIPEEGSYYEDLKVNGNLISAGPLCEDCNEDLIEADPGPDDLE